jgi:prepilin-type N-terminal cleavage/methylation domain-containing protein
VNSRGREVSFRTKTMQNPRRWLVCRLLTSEAGFTLLEVIVAITILGLAVTGLAGALATGLRIANTVEEQTVSATLATRHMEEMIAGVGAVENCGILDPSKDHSIECAESAESDEITVTIYSGGDVLFEIATHNVDDQ